ncbi:MAG: CidA/LrgA family protein [Desulfarculaceae bacterium]|jgi:holin-like protein
MISSLFYLFGLLLVGEALVQATALPIPGNVIGMMLLFLCLSRGWIKLEAVRPAADVLLKNMAFLFVPPGVGLMLYFDVLQKEWLPISVAFVFSSFAVLLVVGLVQQALEKGRG